MQRFRRLFALAVLQFAAIVCSGPFANAAADPPMPYCCTSNNQGVCNRRGKNTVCNGRYKNGVYYRDVRYDWKYDGGNACYRALCHSNCGCTQCGKGKHVDVKPSLTVDRKCNPCPSGNYSDVINADTCKDQPTCGAGESYFLNRDTPLSAVRTCQLCPRGKYQESKQHYSVKCNDCKADEITLQEGSTNRGSCQSVSVEFKASSHRLWVIFSKNLEGQAACAVATVQVVDRVNSRAAPITIPGDNTTKPALCTEAYRNMTTHFPLKYDQQLVMPGKDPFADYPLLLSGTKTLKIDVRPGQTFKISIKVIQDSARALTPYIQEVETPCGCSRLSRLSHSNNYDAKEICVEGHVAIDADGNKEMVDCASEKDIDGKESSIAWLSDSTGRPGRVLQGGKRLPFARQHFGLIQFQWMDYSLCEEAYSFSREVDGRIETFVEDAFFAGNQECDEMVNIPSVVDHLWTTRDVDDKVQPSTRRKYCIRAVSKSAVGSEGYSSPPECEDLTVFWEAGIQGRVVSRRGTIPIEGVEVAWEIRDSGGRVTTASATPTPEGAITDHDGKFFLHLKDLNSRDSTVTRTIHLKYSKSVSENADVFHEFWCPGDVKCGGSDLSKSKFDDFKHTVTATHLIFDTPASIVDVTTVPFTGNVFFPLEAQVLPEGADPNALVWPDEWSKTPADRVANGEMRCPLRDARVCQHTYASGAEELACATTKPDGTYEFAALPHIPSMIRITLGSHEPSQFQRRQEHEEYEGISELKPSVTPDIECPPEHPNCIEVFTIKPDEFTDSGRGLNKMDYEDQTTVALNVDVHGTLCKLPLGDAAFVKFSVPYCGYKTVILQTSRKPNNFVQLPAQSFDVTLEAIQPPYLEVTDPSQMGYFHRLRTRTRRVDLLAEPTPGEAAGGGGGDNQDEAADSDGDVVAGATNKLQSVEFEYHPAPNMKVRFFKPTEDGTLEALPSPACSQTNVVDTSIGQERILTSEQSPKWAMQAGTLFTAVAQPLATIKFPADQFSVCDWIEGHISHHSNVGLSRADANWFKMDKVETRLTPKDATTTEFKEFARTLNKTLPSKVKMADLAKCADPEDPACLISTVHDTKWTVRTDFSTDSTCSVVKDTGTYESGYKPILGDAELCKAQWSKRSSAGAFQAWHLLDWDRDLTIEQRQTWESVGVTKEHYARGQVARTWNEFSKVVLATTDSWSNLQIKNLTAAIASELHFTLDTWGRAWAFSDRIFLNDVSVLPSWNDDLTSAEQAALETLGFTEATWSEKDPAKIFNSGLVADRFLHNNSADARVCIYTSDGKVKPWTSPAGNTSNSSLQLYGAGDVDAPADQKGNISKILRITPWQWDRALAAASSGTQVEGCFWDHGRGGAITTAWFSDVVEKEDLHAGSYRRRHRRVDRKERASIDSLRACPAGEQSTIDGGGCERCPADLYKSAEMALDSTCKQKIRSCQPNASVFRGGSAVRDDNQCIPNGQCPIGQEMVKQGQTEACKECVAGQFKAATSADQCTPKGSEQCKAGEYKIVGSSAIADDNMCITCPMGTFSLTTSALECTIKSAPSSCGVGTFLELGTSTIKDDNDCIICPDGTWKSGLAASLSCTAKAVTTCPPGEYLSAGLQMNVDDNMCLACPSGTFAASTSNAKTCVAKSVVVCPQGQVLHVGLSSAADDNVCLTPGSCAAGYYKKSTASGTCTPCEHGTFAPRVSTATECEPKAVQACPPGRLVFFGSSNVSDDSQCITCPPGTFKGPEHSNSSKACFLKRELPKTCPVSSHVSRGLSTISDDHECQPCTGGSFQSNDATKATRCTLKVQPVGGCPAGEYLSLGESKAQDDYQCKECAEGTFKPLGALSEAVSCPQKTTADQCKGAERLVVYNVLIRDDECAMPSRCGPGQRVAEDKVGCETCPDGQYNARATIIQNCTKKSNLSGGCVAGTYFKKGNDPKRDDWGCIRCPPGTYSDTTDLTPSNCSRKEVPASGCGPGEEMHWGLSTVQNDWFCMPTARLTMLCAKSRKVAARSIAANLAVGMPLRVAPFTTQYRASIAVNGYAPVTAEEVIVLTGSRFVSDAEKVPFPEGRPLVVLHDPPGGESFSSFTDTKATAHVRVTEQSEENVADVNFGGGGGIGLSVGCPPLFTITCALEFAVRMTQQYQGSRTNVQTSSNTELIDDDSFTFSYQTSNSPAFAGPASDALLMPALTFEVIEIWIVKFHSTTENDCRIRGFTDKSLKARTDLSAFYFITASDVETRTLPALQDVSNDVKRRLGCDDGVVPCCSKEEEEVNCKASDLSDYCAWKYSEEEDSSGGYERCKSIAEDHWKTKCQTAAALARGRIASEAVWSECATSNPTCSDGLQPSGDAVQCEKEIEENFSQPDAQTLLDDTKMIGKKGNKIKGVIKILADVVRGAITCMDSGCTSSESSFKVKCVSKEAEVGPLGACSKTSRGILIYANSVDQYCNLKHTEDKAAALACSKFTRTDQYSRAHDDWYNTLGRNYAKQEKAIVGPDAAVPYTVLDTLSTGDKPVETGDLVQLAPMTGLAPQMLIDNAMDRNGELQPGEKRASFNEYNTLSFEGGGSSMEVRWETGDVANGNDFNGHVVEETSTSGGRKSFSDTTSISLELALFVLQVAGDFMMQNLVDRSHLVTELTSSSEEAETAFTLSDPDPGDYFIVTVWQDPEYPTPLFAIQGGASSCKWEYNTYHRAAPTIKVDYVGPYYLPPNEPAVFKVTLENAVQYYERGPSSGKIRPGWTVHDTGYKLPSFRFAVRPQSLKYGLAITVNGRSVMGNAMVLPGFGKGSAEIVAELHASSSVLEPATLDGWRTFPAPVVMFGQECKQSRLAVDLGEQAVEATLGVAGAADERVVRFLQTCPGVAWSGKIHWDSTFSIDADPAAAVDFKIANPTGESWASGSIFSKLIFEFRFQNVGGQASSWTPDSSVALTPTQQDAFITGRWTGPPVNYPDGRYQIRVLAACSNEKDGELAELAQSSTAVIEGVVDRKPPAIVSALPSSGGRHLLPGGMLIVTFDDGVVCSEEFSKPNFLIATTDAAVTFSVENQQLGFVCQGATVSITFTVVGAEAFTTHFNDASSLENVDFKVSVVRGVADIAGNKAAGEFLIGESTVDSLASYALSAGKIEGSSSSNKKPLKANANASTGTDTNENVGKQPAGTLDSPDTSASGSNKGASVAPSAAGAATNSYVAAVLIILVMVGMFVYNQRALAALAVQVRAIHMTDLKLDPDNGGDADITYADESGTQDFKETKFDSVTESIAVSVDSAAASVPRRQNTSTAQSASQRVVNNETYETTAAPLKFAADNGIDADNGDNDLDMDI